MRRVDGTEISVPYELALFMQIWGPASPRGSRDRGCRTYGNLSQSR